jgi:hypothetical protein
MSQTLAYILSHILWLVSSALAVFEIVIATRILSRVYGLTSPNRWIHGALDRFGILILSVVGMGFVFFCEHYYREGVKKGEFWKRFGLVTGAEVVVLLALTVGAFAL